MNREIRYEVEYPHPPARVWQALTQREALAAWLMPNDFEPQVGHSFQFRTEPAPGFDGIVNCQVLEVDEPRRLSFTWAGGPIDTVVTFDLEPTPSGTKLRFRQSGFEGFKANLVRLILRSGFRKMYRRKLPALLDGIARGGIAPASEATANGCEKRGFWRVLTAVFGPVLRRGSND